MPEDAAAAELINDPIFQRLEDQITWYSSKSRSAQRIFKRIKIVEIIAAALIPFLSGLSFGTKFYIPMITGFLGMLITILEGILHLNQYQQNWTNYRSTAESLKHEKFVYIAKAGPYAAVADPHALLAERIESLVSQEHAQWASVQQQSTKQENKTAG
jgi:ABC-type multidrug transport system fused ATPase/permease subunit